MRIRAIDTPSATYYGAMHGAWQGEYSLMLTDAQAFRAAPLAWLDRMRVRSMVTMRGVLGALRMETIVDARSNSDRREVLHTTRIAKWGVTLFRSEEVLALGEDGRTAAFSGRYWMSPTPWRAQPWDEASVEVDQDAKGARYTLRWLGVPMRQETHVVPEGLRVVQETAWSRAEVLLRRC